MSGDAQLPSNKVRLYVCLLNEGATCARPTTGVFVARDVVRVDATENYDPEDEEWEFPPGSEVRLVAEMWSDGQILVARSRADASPEP